MADAASARRSRGGLSEAIWFRFGRLPLLQAVENAVLSIVIVGMGASLGREAAPKLTGAAIANVLASWGRLSDAERRLAACGAGAGMGAVYNVPFGGALFALEVLLGTLALPLVAPALLTSLTATWVAWLFIPNQPTYSIPDDYFASSGLIVWALLAGPLAGLAAAVYVRAIAWADSRKPVGWHVLFLPALIFTLLGLLALPFPASRQRQGLRSKGVSRPARSRTSFCLAALEAPRDIGLPRSGAPGGLFTPTLTCGAMFGGGLGGLWSMVWPGTALGSYAIVGGGALLAAATQSPIAAIVLMLELVPGTTRLAVPDAGGCWRGLCRRPVGDALDLFGPPFRVAGK